MPICILGIGDCSTESHAKSKVSQQYESVTSMIKEKISNTTSNNSTVVANNVNIDLETKKGDIILDGISIRQIIQVTSATSIKIAEMLKSDDTVNELVDTASKIALDADSKSSGLGGGQSRSYTDSETEMITSIKKQFKSIIHTTSFSSCLTNLSNNTQIKAITGDGNIIIHHGINIDQEITATLSCVMNMMKKILSKIKLDTTTKQKLVEDDKARATKKGFDLGEIISKYNKQLMLGGGLILLLIILLIMYFSLHHTNVGVSRISPDATSVSKEVSKKLSKKKKKKKKKKKTKNK